MTVPHADFAIPIEVPLEVSTSVGVNGRVIAIGWWVEPDAATDPTHEATGTLYLVVDPSHPRPMWVPQGTLTSTNLRSSD